MVFQLCNGDLLIDASYLYELLVNKVILKDELKLESLVWVGVGYRCCVVIPVMHRF